MCYAYNYPTLCSVVTDAMALLARFFALPLDAKMDAHVHKNPAIRGYEPQ